LEGNFIVLFKIVGGAAWIVLNYFKSKFIKVRNKKMFPFCTLKLPNILRTCEIDITTVGRF